MFHMNHDNKAKSIYMQVFVFSYYWLTDEPNVTILIDHCHPCGFYHAGN